MKRKQCDGACDPSCEMFSLCDDRRKVSDVTVLLREKNISKKEEKNISNALVCS